MKCLLSVWSNILYMWTKLEKNELIHTVWRIIQWCCKAMSSICERYEEWHENDDNGYGQRDDEQIAGYGEGKRDRECCQEPFPPIWFVIRRGLSLSRCTAADDQRPHLRHALLRDRENESRGIYSLGSALIIWFKTLIQLVIYFVLILVHIWYLTYFYINNYKCKSFQTRIIKTYIPAMSSRYSCLMSCTSSIVLLCVRWGLSRRLQRWVLWLRPPSSSLSVVSCRVIRWRFLFRELIRWREPTIWSLNESQCR